MRNHSITTLSASDGYPLRCRVWPAVESRAWVVFLHGVVSHSLWLDNVASVLQHGGYTCIGMDRRGAGLNTDNRGDAPDAEQLLADVDVVMQWALSQHSRVHACGFCWGANYLVNYLALYTPLIRSVALLAPSIFPASLITERDFVTGDSSEPTEVPLIPLESFTQGDAYENFILPDRLRLDRVSPRMNSIMASFSQGVWVKFLRLDYPVFMALATADEVVDNASTSRVFQRLGSHRKQLCSLDAMHGIQFDAGDELASKLNQWFDEGTSRQPDKEEED